MQKIAKKQRGKSVFVIPKSFQEVIDKIARANISVNWFFIGSVGVELEGLRFDWVPLDIDIAVDDAALESFRALFGEQGKQTKDSVFFDVAGVSVELCLKPKDYKFFEKIKTKKGLNTISLTDQIERYYAAGSPQKAQQIEKLLKKMN